MPVLDALAELVDHSLLRRASPGLASRRGSRCWRPSASSRPSRLLELPERSRVRAGHAALFWELAKDLARPPACPDRAGLDLLELEHDNFRAALDWYCGEDPAMALRLANRLTGFWSVRGHFSEGRRRLGELLGRVPDDDPERMDALSGAGWLATDQGDSAVGRRLARREHRHVPVRRMTPCGRPSALYLPGPRQGLISGRPRPGAGRTSSGR